MSFLFSYLLSFFRFSGALNQNMKSDFKYFKPVGGDCKIKNMKLMISVITYDVMQGRDQGGVKYYADPKSVPSQSVQSGQVRSGQVCLSVC